MKPRRICDDSRTVEIRALESWKALRTEILRFLGDRRRFCLVVVMNLVEKSLAYLGEEGGQFSFRLF